MMKKEKQSRTMGTVMYLKIQEQELLLQQHTFFEKEEKEKRGTETWYLFEKE